MLVEHGEIRSNSSIELVGGCVLIFRGFIECGKDGSYGFDFREFV